MERLRLISTAFAICPTSSGRKCAGHNRNERGYMRPVFSDVAGDVPRFSAWMSGWFSNRQTGKGEF